VRNPIIPSKLHPVPVEGIICATPDPIARIATIWRISYPVRSFHSSRRKTQRLANTDIIARSEVPSAR